MSRALRVLACVTALMTAGCPAVYPELATRMRAPASGQDLTPPPPEDLRWIRILSAHIPEHARDGRTWDRARGSLPDPYARVMVNGRELFRTAVQSDTIDPTWPGSPSGNFRISPDDRLRVEVWDSSPLNDRPLGTRDIGRPSEEDRSSGRIEVELEGGGSLTLAFEPAHARIGLGLWYELRTGSTFISRTMAGSPAERAGLLAGDQVLKIRGRDVRGMTDGEVRSAFNAIPHGGLVLLVKHATGVTQEITIAEGPIYPTFEQFGAME